ncbi:MAG TPA: shikimate kinase [Bryobacterales bacterium]|nr:shikimate kinase [Bryobacterales bacterium]
MILKLKRTPGLYLVGFMGCGKTTVGRRLADELGWRFADVDEEIEAKTGMKIADIFDQRGEEEFRRIEHEAIAERVREIERGRPTVVALGGGAFTRDENVELVTEHGVAIWLDCPLEVCRKRVAETDERPLARDPERFARLYEERRPAYARADYRIETGDDPPEEVVRRILELPIF